MVMLCYVMIMSISTPPRRLTHYTKTSMQYTAIFHGCKNLIFREKLKYFHIFAQNIDRGYTLEPPQLSRF